MAKVQNSKKRLSQVIRADDYMGFIKFLTRTSTNDELMPSTKEMLQTITSHRAIECLSILLNIKFPQGFDAAEGGLDPLQIAAHSLWLDGTDTIIKHGALMTDVPCHDPTHSPLSYALKAIRDNTYVSEWNTKISIFKLIFIFCLPELNEPLETVKLLASKSKTEQLEMISLRCVLQGEVAQLTALLLVAWDKLVKPFSDQGIEGSTIGSLILNELRRFQGDSVSQSCNSSSDAGAGEHVVTLENAWRVLHILGIARNTIEECRLDLVNNRMETHLVPFHVASDLGRRHRIYLKAEDVLAGDVKCLMPRRTPQQKAWLLRRIDKEIRTVSTLPALSESRMAETPERHCISHSFHTLTPNLVKPARSGASRACPKPVGRFSNFLASRATATVIPRLISALKRV